MKKIRVKGQGSRVKGRKTRYLSLVTVFLLVTCHLSLVTVFASEGGGEHAAFTWKDWLWPVINFAILVFVLVHFGRKPMAEYFKKRTEVIEKSLREATEAKELAQKALDEVRARLGNTGREIDDIVASAKKAGEKEKEAIVAEGERMKEKIVEQAKANIDFELQKAKDKIKSEAAMMALELAEKQIREKLGQKEQEALVDDYI
ncbi:MAG: ATP synthase F0 subunit B, partial [Nitrospiraceae bacterium]